MSGFPAFLLVFVLTSQALAFAIGIIARFWVQRTDSVVLHGIDLARARDLVGTYVENLNDNRFGFPTGVFRVDEAASTPGKLVAREVNFHGSTGFQVARFAMVIPAMFVEAAADEGCAAGAIALLLGVMFAAVFVVPILAVSVVEVVLRALMKSRITAKLQMVSGDADTCAVEFELMGLSAYGARRSLMSGLAKPALPARWGGSIGQSAEPWQADRLNQVYAGGAVIAIAVAAAIVASHPHLGGPTTPSYAQYSYNAPSGSGSGVGSAGDGGAPSGGGEQGGSSSDSGPATLPAPSRTIRSHYERLGAGDYVGAFSLMSWRYRSANQRWVENRTTADPVIKIVGVGPPHYRHGSARVYVKFYAKDRNSTRGSDTRCRLFRGFVNTVGHASVWRYEPAQNSLVATVEPAGDPNCNG